MQLEDYFETDILESDLVGRIEKIRLKGSRIGIEHVIQYFKEGYEPIAIVRDIYSTLTLTEVYTIITYYLLNREEMDEYIRRGDEIGEAFYQENLRKEPPECIKRIRELKKDPEKLKFFLASQKERREANL